MYKRTTHPVCTYKVRQTRMERYMKFKNPPKNIYINKG